MLASLLPTLIMVTIVAIFLFLICETTISFVFYFTGFLLVLTLVNLWYLSRSRIELETDVLEGETLITRRHRDGQLPSFSKHPVVTHTSNRLISTCQSD